MRATKKLLITSLLVVGLSLLLSGCGTKSTEQIIKIGVITPLSGPASPYGEDALHGYMYQLSQQPQELQDRIELVIEDGKCNGKDAASAAIKLITVDKVVAILGGQCSGETMAAGKISQNYKVPILSPLSQKPSIHEIGDYVYRFWNGAILTDAYVKYFSESGKKKIGIIVENTDFPLGLANKFEETFQYDLIFKQEFSSDEKDYNLLVKKLANQIIGLDGLIILTQSDATAIGVINGLRKEGVYESIRENIYGTTMFSSKPAIESLGIEIIEGLKEAGLSTMLDSYKNSFIKGFKTVYDVQFEDASPTVSAEGMQLIVDAISAGNDNRVSIKEYFDGINKENPRVGIFGEYYFTNEGEAIGLKGALYEIVDGGRKVFSE